MYWGGGGGGGGGGGIDRRLRWAICPSAAVSVDSLAPLVNQEDTQVHLAEVLAVCL